MTNTLKFFKKEFEDRPLKESTVRTWVKQYTHQLATQSTKETEVDELVIKKRGRPLLLGPELDRQV